jgi:chromosome segregation ATPase
MSDRPSAVVISFPRGRADARAEDPRLRLKLVLAELGAALVEQRNAVADWRLSLASLHGKAGALTNSLLDYRAELAALDGRLGRLHEEARRLERLAAGVQTAASDLAPRFGRPGGPGFAD